MIARKIHPASAILHAVLLLLGMALSVPVKANQPAPPFAKKGVVLTFSDVHYNPFYDPTLAAQILAADSSQWRAIFESSSIKDYGHYGEETGYPLLKSLLENMKSVEAKPRFIILTGDLLAHDFRTTFNSYSPDLSDSAYYHFVRTTLGFLASMVNSYFPQTVVLPALGNNDTYTGNYTVNAQFLADYVRIWGPLVQRSGDTSSVMSDFPQGGYYSTMVPGLSGHRVITLNTILFSVNSTDSYRANAELAWLDSTLAASQGKGERVWLAYHIAPGINTFNSVDPSGICKNPPVMFWQPGYQNRFLGLMKTYAATIDASFAGHSHMDDFRLLSDSLGSAPFGFVHVTPGVSPVYNNNPGFQQFIVNDTTPTIEDYATYFTTVTVPNLPPPPPQKTWQKEYEFVSTYGQSPYTTASLVNVFNAMYHDPVIKKLYIRYYAVSSTYKNSLTPVTWPGYACTIVNLAPTGFATCCGGK